MTNYICTNCNSRFDLENIAGCPHCGGIVKEEKNAEELLEEIEDILES